MSRRLKNLSLLLGPLAVALVPLLLLAQPPLFNYAPGARQATRQVSGVQAPISVRGGAAFNPTDIAGLQLWLDAAQIAGLNDGDAVATWTDRSGNANNAVQATASRRPTYQTAEINSLPAVQLDGVDDFLDLTSSINATNFTVFIVGRKSTGAALHFVGVCAKAVGAAMSPLYYGGDGNFYTQTQTGAYRVTAGQNATLQSNFLYTGYSNGGSPQHRLNRSLLGGSNASSGSPTAFDSIGARTVFGDYGNQLLGEVLVYDSSLSAGDIALVEDYLQAKWGTP